MLTLSMRSHARGASPVLSTLTRFVAQAIKQRSVGLAAMTTKILTNDSLWSLICG